MIDNKINVLKTFSDYSDEVPVQYIKFKIPEKDFLTGIVEGNIYLGNVGEGEFVLNPYWAKNYLSSINGEAATITKDGKIILTRAAPTEEYLTKEAKKYGELKRWSIENPSTYQTFKKLKNADCKIKLNTVPIQ